MTISIGIITKGQIFLTQNKNIIISFVVMLVFFNLMRFSSFEPKIHPNDYANNNFNVLGLNIPSNLDFAGEKVPQNDVEIKESLEKEFFTNKSWKNSTISLFIKAQKWFPIIEPILKKEGVPDDFKYVAVIESHLTNVVSPMGATGFWQLMPQTAQGYGLIVNSNVDERYDVEKSTYAACKHFKDAYNYFKNWTLSAAAYNVGIGGIQQALKKQKTDNYYDLLLNKETGVFVYRILAYKTLLSNPKHFGINSKVRKVSAYPPYKIVKVDSTITNLHAFAKHIGTDIVTLKAFNVWLIGDMLPNTNKTVYAFRIPKNKNVDLSSFFEDIYPQQTSVDTTQTQISVDTLILKVDTLPKK